jgi:hypothetical protein
MFAVGGNVTAIPMQTEHIEHEHVSYAQLSHMRNESCDAVSKLCYD